MSDNRRCIRCERGIDAWAKLCPYCNWDQSNTAPPPAPQLREAAPVRSEDDLKDLIKRKGLYAGGGVLILIVAFLVGMIINSDGAPKTAPEPIAEQDQKVIPPVKRADTPLVPTNERGGIEQPITSAPVAAQPNGLPSAYDRSDATAVSSSEYNQLARRARAEKERMDVLVDPRSLSGVAYAQGQRPARPVAQMPMQGVGNVPNGVPPVAEAPRRGHASIRTRPVPQYQPIPHIAARGTARLSLLIGPDGRVRDINIERALDRNTVDLVAAVQRWRFKPATENGEPVSAPYSVDISFGGQ